MITIKDVQECFDATLRKKATPHRTPDFKQIFKEFPADTPVNGERWFLEEHNTGYDGLLERWEFRTEDKKLSFWADLLPGLIVTRVE